MRSFIRKMSAKTHPTMILTLHLIIKGAEKLDEHKAYEKEQFENMYGTSLTKCEIPTKPEHETRELPKTCYIPC